MPRYAAHTVYKLLSLQQFIVHRSVAWGPIGALPVVADDCDWTARLLGYLDK